MSRLVTVTRVLTVCTLCFSLSFAHAAKRQRPASPPPDPPPVQAAAPEQPVVPPPVAPPPPAPEVAMSPIAAPAPPPVTKAGPIMINLRLGGAVGIFAATDGKFASGSAPGQFVVGAEFGYGFGREHNIYLIVPLAFHYIPDLGYSYIMIPVGVQFDIPIRAVPGLYIYPRVSVGYSGLIASGQVAHGVVFTPEFGIKYVLRGRLNLGVDPVSFPITYYPESKVASGAYRFTVYAGVNL